MKKLFTSVLCMTMAIASHASLNVFINQAGDEGATLTEDTKITITEFVEEFGEITTEVSGNVNSNESNNLKVTIHRSDTVYFDSFCSGVNCIPTNNLFTQEIGFTVSNPTESVIRIHYNPIEEGTETISYTFSDGVNKDITLTVDYVYSATAFTQTEVNPTAKGIFTILGQRIAATSLDELPKGIYIVNGKKVVKQ
ncbi:MAG: hypothetical protein ACI4TV_04955 [Paludibacteraceae bacterium]